MATFSVGVWFFREFFIDRSFVITDHLSAFSGGLFRTS
jgi:hypothetical protein